MELERHLIHLPSNAGACTVLRKPNWRARADSRPNDESGDIRPIICSPGPISAQIPGFSLDFIA
jgi:hypothetical protein